MGGLSKIVSDLPEGYGYVILVGCVGNTFLNMWLGINVSRARKRYGVPKLAAGTGALFFLFARVVYALGYYTGDPSKRMRGAFGHLGFWGFLGASVHIAARQLGWGC